MNRAPRVWRASDRRIALALLLGLVLGALSGCYGEDAIGYRVWTENVDGCAYVVASIAGEGIAITPAVAQPSTCPDFGQEPAFE